MSKMSKLDILALKQIRESYNKNLTNVVNLKYQINVISKVEIYSELEKIAKELIKMSMWIDALIEKTKEG